MEKCKRNPLEAIAGLLGVKPDEETLNAPLWPFRGKFDLDGLKEQAQSLMGGLIEKSAYCFEGKCCRNKRARIC